MMFYRQEDVAIQIDSHKDKVPMTTGNLLINGQIFKCASGGWGDGIGYSGPIVAGIYAVSPAIRLPDIAKNQAYRGEKFPWFSRLTPLFKTAHTGYLIHPKGKYLGTFGCIEASERDVELFEILSKIKSETLKVI